MGWNYLSIPKLQRCNRWSLGMDKLFHPILYNGYNYLSMLGLKLNHVSKRGHRKLHVILLNSFSWLQRLIVLISNLVCLFLPLVFFRFWHLKISQLKTIYSFVEIWCWISHGSRLLQHAPLMWKTSCFQCMQLALDVSEFSAAILNDVSKSSDITDSQRNIGHHISNLLVNTVNVDGLEPIGVRTQICRPGGDYVYQHLNNRRIVHIPISHRDNLP